MPNESNASQPNTTDSFISEDVDSCRTHHPSPPSSSASPPTQPLDEQQQIQRKRPLCERCHRPTPSVCICEGLPNEPIRLKRCHCFILQHPHENRRKNRSVPLLQLSLHESSLTVLVGRKFVHPSQIETVLTKMGYPCNGNCTKAVQIWLIYPDPNAISLEEALSRLTATATRDRSNRRAANEISSGNSNDGKEGSNPSECERPEVLVIFYDATWKFAAEMDRASDLFYKKNPDFPIIRVQLSPHEDLEGIETHRFEIRKPPAAFHLSTAEAVSRVLSKIEHDPNLHDSLMRPLDVMVFRWQSCKNQADHPNQLVAS